MSSEETSNLALFEGKRIRQVEHQGEGWFVITDTLCTCLLRIA